ncbi:MAG: O-antigen ligase family protein [Patescibacteria group bacterium]
MVLVDCLVLALMLLFPLGQLEKLPLGITGVSIYVHDLVLAVAWAYLFLKHRDQLRAWLKAKTLLKDKLLFFFLVFSGIALACWCLALPDWGRDSFKGLGYLVRWLLLLAPYLLFKLRGAKANLPLIRRSIYLMIVLSWIFYLWLPDARHLKLFGWDDHYFRLIGTILDPNYLAIIIVLGFGLELARRKQSLVRIVFLLLSLGLTYSRAGWLSLGVLILGWALAKRKLIKPIFYLSLGLLVFYFIPKPIGEGGNLLRTASVNARLVNYQQSWQVIKDHPVWGVGFNNYPLSSQGNNKADNSLLLVWATTGIVGLVVFLLWWFQLKPTWLFAPILFHSMFNNTLFYPWVLMLVWGISANSKNLSDSVEQ